MSSRRHSQSQQNPFTPQAGTRHRSSSTENLQLISFIHFLARQSAHEYLRATGTQSNIDGEGK